MTLKGVTQVDLYTAVRKAQTKVSAGGILAMDRYNNDEIAALEYDQEGHRTQRHWRQGQRGLTPVQRGRSVYASARKRNLDQ